MTLALCQGPSVQAQTPPSTLGTAQGAPQPANTTPATPAPTASEPSATSAPATPPPADSAATPVDPSGTSDTLTQEAPVVGEASLPRDLSPIGMFLAADWIVKTVMIGLAFASVVTWSVWLAKLIELFSARRQTQRDLVILAKVKTLADAAEALRNSKSDVAKLARAALLEVGLSGGAMAPEGVKERVASRFQRIEAAAGRRMTRGTSILATIGATGPFVGLFGTVWGIMNSFIGISKAQTTNLAVVAPGIAEALLATALGLVAAIPAVVIYNMFARWIAGYRATLGDGSAELLRHVSRDLDRGHIGVDAGGRPVYRAAE
ncbi:MAG: tonB-system energizer ExbB [Rhizobiales bacterium]|nr:tonB-system energizer ExbB [Hyphomicrobiales bacterium]